MGSSSDLITWVAMLCAVKPVIMTGSMVLLQTFHDPLYANPVCAARCAVGVCLFRRFC
jgi:hypothetical protein